MSNFSGTKPLVLGEKEEFAAFNRLPKEFRAALNNCKFKWSARELIEYWERCRDLGIPRHEVLDFIAEQERIVVRKTTRDEWGDDYIPTVYGGRLPYN